MSQPPTQLSPDGKYFWDGQRWLPVPETQLAAPAFAQPVGSPPTPLVMYRPATNSLAVASLVFGIVSWLLCPLVSSLVAIICGHIAHSQIRRTGESGSGLATAGLILGYVNLAAGAIFLFIAFVFFGGVLALLGAIGSSVPSPSP